MVAVLIAFLSLGSVVAWGLTRGNMSIFSDLDLTRPIAVSPEAVPLAEAPELDDARARLRATAPVPTSPGRRETDDVDFNNMTAREELAARAAVRRTRAEEAAVGVDPGVAAAGTAAGIAATADSVTADELEQPAAEVIPPVRASEAASAEPQDAIVFSDVPDDYWAKPYIDALSSRGLISGYDDNTFRPDQPVTRAQTANIVSRTFDLTADKASLEFSDVEPDYWARESIGEVVRGGFMTGFPDDTFKPNLPVTRAQALTTLVTGLGIEPPQNIQAALSRYTDANAIPQWANEKVAAATDGSLVVNYPEPTQLKPTEPTTRAELSALIYQALVREGVVEPVESEYVIKP